MDVFLLAYHGMQPLWLGSHHQEMFSCQVLIKIWLRLALEFIPPIGANRKMNVQTTLDVHTTLLQNRACRTEAARTFCEFLRLPTAVLQVCTAALRQSCGSGAKSWLFFLRISNGLCDHRTTIVVLPCGVYGHCGPVLTHCKFVCGTQGRDCEFVRQK